ncbi:hypothetical protein MHI22_16895 [Lysinibacillus sp. FSL L8-0312]|uniref:hypothetical protein n=1 Tax=Lysinibacillus sp. FSL L8-0312 TaxID=2921521 RepID=UPI0030F985B4
MSTAQTAMLKGEGVISVPPASFPGGSSLNPCGKGVFSFSFILAVAIKIFV